jgi:hypothetical protein
MEISGVLFVLLMLALIAALVEHSKNRKLRAKMEARRIQGSQSWDWTKKSERKAQAALELICDKCKERDSIDPDKLNEECLLCAIPDIVFKLTMGESKNE